MSKARIYLPSKTAMQSGKANTKRWHLEFDVAGARFVEPLMGWTGSHDTASQLNLTFETREEAVSYAEREGLDYEVEEPHARSPKPRAYADNFAFNRIR